jgi:hypothetical protein
VVNGAASFHWKGVVVVVDLLGRRNMQPTDPAGGVTSPTVPTVQSDDAALDLDIIRTETVLSRLPVHNLAKTGNIDIQIIKTTPEGKVDLKWIVSYSDRYGQARQLAYKLDTLVINRHIEEQGQPVPKIIRLGTLREIAEELDLGGDTNNVRLALRQNASVFITAEMEYQGNNGSTKTLGADFSRYSVTFKGETLPNGRKADAVYIVFNDIYREVLNNAPVRPLNRAYMKELPPTSQRFYEIVSLKIFAAIRNGYPFAKLAYSEYCTFSAQIRHYERQPVQDQMAKVLRPHKASGYIAEVKYEAIFDAENKPDWMMLLKPGPRARAEYVAVHRKRTQPAIVEGNLEREERAPVLLQPKKPQKSAEAAVSQAQSPNPVPPPPQVDEALVVELAKRGIGDSEARRYLAQIKPGQPVMDQIEYADSIINHPRSQIRNPQGFILTTILENRSVPPNFETSARRKAREEEELRKREEEMQQQILRAEYEEYQQGEVEKYAVSLPDWEKQISSRVSQLKRQSRCKTYTPDILRQIAARELQSEMASRIPGILSFEAYCELHKCAS